MTRFCPDCGARLIVWHSEDGEETRYACPECEEEK
jgi:DNA-directed RNA polymerase subunit M/transcription elongation factor TFIIS